MLKACLDSIEAAGEGSSFKWEGIVVDNSQSPESLADNQEIMTLFPNWSLRHVMEKGLSLARNEGVRCAKGKYVGYIDDDAVMEKSFFKFLADHIDNGRYDCFGGAIISYWPYGRPRWLDPGYGSKPALLGQAGPLKTDFIWGGNMFFKKESLIAVGGFREGYGLRGDRLGYGVENLVQIKLRERGYIVGYDPRLVVQHAVLPQKLKLFWHIRSAYATARDGKLVFPDQYSVKGIGRSIKQILVKPIKGLYALCFNSEYYPENLLLDLMVPISTVCGKLVAISSR